MESQHGLDHYQKICQVVGHLFIETRLQNEALARKLQETQAQLADALKLVKPQVKV